MYMRDLNNPLADCFVILLADRDPATLGPIGETMTHAGAPVAGKSVIEHTLDEIAALGARDVAAVINPGDGNSALLMAGGAPWRMRIRVGSSHQAAAAAAVGSGAPRVLVARADMFRTPSLGLIAGRTRATLRIGGKPAYAAAVPDSPRAVMDAIKDLSADGGGRAAGCETFDAVGLFYHLDSAPALLALNMAVLNGKAQTVAPSGRPLARRGAARWLGGLRPRNLERGPVYIGEAVAADPTARIAGSVICDGGLIGARARVRNSLVLPNVYVGADTTLDGMIAGPDFVIDGETGAVAPIADEFLLSSGGSAGEIRSSLTRRG